MSDDDNISLALIDRISSKNKGKGSPLIWNGSPLTWKGNPLIYWNAAPIIPFLIVTINYPTLTTHKI